jgi:hypothetical protein
MDSRGQRRETVSSDSRRGQATVLGAVLVLGMVISGTAIVVTLGATALTDTQSTSELERGENSMTLFNTRTSMVALGNSPSQSVSFGRDSGSLESNSDAGWMRVTHNDFRPGDDEVIFNKSLGSVVYTNDGTEIAYQGGGVWRKGETGDALMVSPPEFHYRGATLTLPIVRVGTDESDGGGATATITRAHPTRRVFPNETAPTSGTNEIGAPYNGTDRDYENPVANGTVNVTVQSSYYQGWADYFRQRTDGAVTEFPGKNRVRVSLESLAGSVGEFEMPAVGNSVPVRGLGDDHPINTYELTLAADGNFNNMHWSMYADNGNEQFEIHFFSEGKCNGGSYQSNKDFDVSVYYYNSSGTETIHEEWQNTSIDLLSNDDFDVDCGAGEITVDLMSDTTMTMGDIALTGSDNKWEYGPEISSRSVASETNSFTVHDNGSIDMGNYTTGETEELGFVVNHYFDLLGPQFDLTVTDGPGGSSRVDEDASSGELDFDTATGAEYITFLHITENEVNVTFD